MTAKELHDLYYPLWVKVPETRPTRETADGQTLHLSFTTQYAVWRNSFGSWYGEQRTLEEAAALARVAVEDWLRARTAITLDHTPGVQMPANTTGKPTAVCPIHHALVAAALAVAGEEKK